MVPNDLLFVLQWHLLNTGDRGGRAGVDLNVLPVWEDYTGQGVTVAVLDEGIDTDHPDLVDAYDPSRDFDSDEQDDDATLTSGEEFHGTAVAGVISQARDNNEGGVGVAYDASLAGIRINYNTLTITSLTNALNEMVNHDIVNNSWGVNVRFADNFFLPAFVGIAQALERAASAGRDGLGTVVTFSAGNAGSSGDDVNYHNFQNSIYTISVAAIDRTGTVASFSTQGAANLVAAPGVQIVTADPVGLDGQVTSDYASYSGTSFAAPAVAGVVALMLEANPRLGYRDVQEILVLSARDLGTETDLVTNGATGFNGGGLTVSHETAHGLIDAHAAVRLAESWGHERTTSNLDRLEATRSTAVAIPDADAFGVFQAVNFDQDIRVEHVEVTLDISHSFVGDLEVDLISPSGTVSRLINRPGQTGNNLFGDSGDDIGFTTSTTLSWGESGQGEWTLVVRDLSATDTGVLESWGITLYGEANVADDDYIYTDGFSDLAQQGSGRQTLTDTDGGRDSLNAAAVTSGSTLRLAPGEVAEIDGVSVLVGSGTTLENAYGGDGNDTISGTSSDNVLSGGRGDDIFTASGGTDTITGGAGEDRLIFTSRFADAEVETLETGLLIQHDGVTQVSGVEVFQFSDVTVTEASLGTGVEVSSSLFDRTAYLAANPDLPAATDALQHFSELGYAEGRLTSFDADAYLAANPDIAAAVEVALTHYLALGRSEGRLLSFSAAEYLEINSDLGAAGIGEDTALAHYQVFGRSEQRLTTFDDEAYRLANPDLATAKPSRADSLEHYLAFGVSEGRGFFDADGYIALNPDAGEGFAPASDVFAQQGGAFALSGTDTDELLIGRSDTASLNGRGGDDRLVFGQDGTTVIGGLGADTFQLIGPETAQETLTGTYFLPDISSVEGDQIVLPTSTTPAFVTQSVQENGETSVRVVGSSFDVELIGVTQGTFSALYEGRAIYTNEGS